MTSMKRFLLVGMLVSSTVLAGYRVFAGPEETAMTCTPQQCTPEECERLCGPCDPSQCK